MQTKMIAFRSSNNNNNKEQEQQMDQQEHTLGERRRCCDYFSWINDALFALQVPGQRQSDKCRRGMSNTHTHRHTQSKVWAQVCHMQPYAVPAIYINTHEAMLQLGKVIAKCAHFISLQRGQSAFAFEWKLKWNYWNSLGIIWNTIALSEVYHGTILIGISAWLSVLIMRQRPFGGAGK